MMSGDTSFDMEAELAKGEAKKEDTTKGKRILGELRDVFGGKEKSPGKVYVGNWRKSSNVDSKDRKSWQISAQSENW